MKRIVLILAVVIASFCISACCCNQKGQKGSCCGDCDKEKTECCCKDGEKKACCKEGEKSECCKEGEHKCCQEGNAEQKPCCNEENQQ